MDDLISRRTAVAALKEEEYPCESDYDEGYMAALKKSVWIMEKWLPSAQPEQPKRGTWIKHEDRAGWCCSECAIDDYYAYFLNSDTGVYELQDKFCYNCGADMRGEQDE